MRARSGETRWVRTFTRPVRVDGRVVELRGVLTDITDQKLAEMALRRSEALLARMTDASPFGYYVVDTRTDGILYFNDRFLEIWGLRDLREGLRRGELRNRDLAGRLLALVSDPDAFVASSAPSAGRGEPRRGRRPSWPWPTGGPSGVFLRNSGTTRTDSTAGSTSSRTSPSSSAWLRSSDDTGTELEELVRERTDELTLANESLRNENVERMVAMKARAESEDRLTRIFQQAPIGMAVVSLDERFLRVNDALCRITGYDRETLLAMGPYDITHPDDVGAGRELTAALLRGEAR